MLISDVIAQHLAKRGIEQAFMFTGGSAARLIDSIGKHNDIDYVCNLHEQASAMSADAYARISKKMPVVVVTSGPGATNVVTGCAGAYYDSVPVLFITGQVSTNYLKEDLGVRQYGFQETDVIPIFDEITKYTARIYNPEDVLYELDKAIHISMTGRKGPVLLDIPEDIQRMEAENIQFRYFQKGEENLNFAGDEIGHFLKMLLAAHNPVLVLGQGIHQANAEENISRLINKLNIPIVHSSAAMDLTSYEDERNYGNFGIYGHTDGNRIIQNSDLLIIIGSRLDHHMTGKNTELFAPDAKKVLVEIDEAEIEKFKATSLTIDLKIKNDINAFIDKILRINIDNKIWDDWRKECREQKQFHSKKMIPMSYPEHCFLSISGQVPEGATIVFDTGCSLIWGMEYFRFKNNQRCITQFNHTSMGYALPASIGAAIAKTDSTVVCISGDGGFQLNIQELATIKCNNYNIKMIVFDNAAFALMLGAQNRYMDGRHIASTKDGGLPLINLENIIHGYGLDVVKVDNESELDMKIAYFFEMEGPACCIIKINMFENAEKPDTKAEK